MSQWWMLPDLITIANASFFSSINFFISVFLLIENH